MAREITVTGKGRKPRTVKMDRDAARSLDRYIPEGDLMELCGGTSPQMLRLCGASARSARARRAYDRIMDTTA